MKEIEEFDFSSLKILYIEDEEAIRTTLEIYMRKYISNLYTAKNGRDGLELYYSQKPDIIITDIMMPELTGIEVIQKIRESDRNTKIIITTAYDDAEFLLDAIKAGVDNYIIKPIQRKDISNMLLKYGKIVVNEKDINSIKSLQESILNSTCEGIFGIDKDGYHTFVNPAAAKLLGYTQSELIGKHSHSLWHYKKENGDEFPAYECPIYGVLQTGVRVNSKKDIFWKSDGSSIYVSYSANPIIDGDSIVGAVVGFSDISNEYKKDMELKKLSSVVKESVSMIVITNRCGDIEFVNRSFCDTTGYEESEIIGQNPRVLKSDKNDASVYEELWSSLKSGKLWRDELINRKKDGSEYWVLITIFPIYDEDQNIVSFAAVSEDITQRKEYERELEMINRNLELKINQEIEKSRQKDSVLFEQKKVIAMGELMRDIAHHWRQPLTAIGMLIQNIKDLYEYDELDDKALDEIVTKALDQLQQLSKTIDNFRSFFKSDNNRSKFKIRKVVDDTLYMLKSAIKLNNIEINVIGDGIDLEIEASINDLKQVVINTLKNSIDSIVEKQKLVRFAPLINIEITSENGATIVKIRDNGIGIKDEVLEKVFEPYFTTKEQGKGVGIGLYMSKMIVERNMDGAIYIDNNKDEGVEVVIKIP